MYSASSNARRSSTAMKEQLYPATCERVKASPAVMMARMEGITSWFLMTVLSSALSAGDSPTDAAKKSAYLDTVSSHVSLRLYSGIQRAYLDFEMKERNGSVKSPFWIKSVMCSC